MKRHDIADNSRAAFYLKRRRASPRLPARDAFHMAQNDVSRHWKARESCALAADALAALWASLGKVEPKRYAPDGEALHKAREAQSLAFSRLSAARAYVPGAGVEKPGGHCSGYFGNGRFYYLTHDDGAGVFRDVTAAHDIAGGPEHTGHYDNGDGEAFNDGTGLVWGVVARLPARDGEERFLAGYQLGGMDSGVSIDLESLTDCERDAARRADSLAENAAAAEREYKDAWRAGATWAELGETIADARRAALALLAERREARKQGGEALPAICRAIHDSVSGHVETIRDARKERADIADAAAYYGKQERAAFHDASGEALPA